MAKQMKRVEKRYVPQQESYRSLPVPSPTASPVNVVPDVPSVDPTAEKLRQITEGLSGLNKGLTDYFRMEKSFEETNRVAQRTRALLGLPQTEGPGGGNLDWGSDYGYQEGKGMADSVLLQDRLMNELEARNFFIDEGSPDPQKTMTDMNTFVQSFISENLGDNQKNVAYMAGASDALAKAKVEATVQAGIRLENLKLQTKVGNYGTWATSVLSQELPKFSDPKDIRELLSRLTAESQRFGISRDAAADHLAATVSQRFTSAFTSAHDSDDVQGMNTAIQEMNLVSKAMTLPDSAGIPFGGVTKDKSGRLVQPLESTRRELEGDMRQMIIDRERAIKRINEKTVDDTSADLLFRMQTKDLKPSEALNELNVLYGKIPSSTYLELQKFVAEVDKADMNVVEVPGLFEETMLNINSTSTDAIRKMMVDGDLKPDSAVALFREKQRILSETNARLGIASKQASLRNQELYRQQQQQKMQRAQVFGNYATKMSPNLTTEELTELKKQWDLNPNLQSEEDLKVLTESVENVRSKRKALKEQADQKKAEANLQSQQMLNDLYQENPNARKYETQLKGILKDPRHSNIEGLRFYAQNFEYAENVQKVTPAGAVAKEVAEANARQISSLFLENLTEAQKAELKRRTQANPSYTIPDGEITMYNRMILQKTQEVKSGFSEGTREHQRALIRLRYLTLFHHPLTPKEDKERIRREIVTLKE